MKRIAILFTVAILVMTFAFATLPVSALQDTYGYTARWLDASEFENSAMWVNWEEDFLAEANGAIELVLDEAAIDDLEIFNGCITFAYDSSKVEIITEAEPDFLNNGIYEGAEIKRRTYVADSGQSIIGEADAEGYKTVCVSWNTGSATQLMEVPEVACIYFKYVNGATSDDFNENTFNFDKIDDQINVPVKACGGLFVSLEYQTITGNCPIVFDYPNMDVEAGPVAPATHAFVVYGEGDVELANETLEEGETITMPSAPAVEGKTFSHWATTKGGSEVEPATTMGTEDLTYYAVYTVNKYTITFVVDGNTTTKEVEHGTIPTYDGTPSKDGYTFTGWDKEFVAATEDTTYTAQFVQNAPTQYEITFVVDGDETIVMTNAGDTPVFPGTPAKDGYNFTGWSPALVPATGAATYTAQFELIPVVPEGDAVTMGEPVYIDGSNGDILPGGVETVKVNPFGTEYTVKAAELLRVHTDFTYDSSKGTLKEMGMLFVPKAVADAAGVSTAEAIVDAEIAKDACCTDIPYLTGGGNVTFKAGLVDIPYKNIEIYAIPYYKLSGGERIYQAMQTILFD